MPLEGQEGLIAQAQLGLNISDNLIREKVIDLIYKQKLYKRLYEGKIVIYLPHIYKAEKTVVQIVSSAIHKNKVIKEDKVDMIIADYEKRKGFTLANKQKESIKTSCINQFSIISGPPGSGKTTILSFIAKIFRYIQRFRDRIPCDFSLAYTIETDGKEHSIILEKIESNITISIDTILYHLMKYDIRTKSYKYDLSIYDKQITYDEIKPYLPANVLVLGFDVDYDRISYSHNY